MDKLLLLSGSKESAGACRATHPHPHLLVPQESRHDLLIAGQAWLYHPVPAATPWMGLGPGQARSGEESRVSGTDILAQPQPPSLGSTAAQLLILLPEGSLPRGSNDTTGVACHSTPGATPSQTPGSCQCGGKQPFLHPGWKEVQLCEASEDKSPVGQSLDPGPEI
jgi:hypothetical protein